MLDEPFEVKWADPAITALEDAYQYIAQENLVAADEFIAEIHRRIAQLATLPELGIKTKVRHLRGTVREVVIGRYRILYRSDPVMRCINILLVWHTSRRNPKPEEFYPPCMLHQDSSHARLLHWLWKISRGKIAVDVPPTMVPTEGVLLLAMPAVHANLRHRWYQSLGVDCHNRIRRRVVAWWVSLTCRTLARLPGEC